MKRSLLVVATVLLAVLSSCELINQPPEVLTVTVQNQHGEATFENFSVAYNFTEDSDTTDGLLSAGSLSPGSSVSDSIAIQKKSFSMSSSVTIHHDGLATEGISITDEVGAANYHSFRALASLDAEIVVTISGTGPVTRYDLHPGYVERFE
jgi:hypothetical protein